MSKGEEKMHKKTICILCISMLIFLQLSGHTEENNSKMNVEKTPDTLAINNDYYTLSEVYSAKISYSDFIWNDESSIPIEVSTRLALAPTSYRQHKIIGEVYYPQGEYDFAFDEWGNRFAIYNRTIYPQSGSLARWSATFLLKKMTFHIDPDIVTDEIPDIIAIKYLCDEDCYDIHNDLLQRKTAEVIGDEANQYRRAKAIHDYIMDELNYSKEGGWDPAPEVLRRGNGSCTEYSYLFVAMCRIAGIPARLVSSTYIDIDTSADLPYVANSKHRWTEIYLPPYGWVPVDVTKDDLKAEKKHRYIDQYFGFTDNIFLVTSISGASSKWLGWGYNSFDKSSSADVIITRLADWFSFDRLSPNIPSTPNGPDNVNAGENNIYETITIDPNGDDVYYWFDWGDGTNSGWLGPFESGMLVEASHTFVEFGDNPVRVKAMDDISYYESNWSAPLIVSMSKNKSITEYRSWIYWLIERFPILEFLL
jgi:transglutaminase-like putative cysteine protease